MTYACKSIDTSSVSGSGNIVLKYIVTLGNRSPPPKFSKHHNVFQWDPIYRWRLVWLYPKGEAESCRMMIGLLPPRQVVEIFFEQESILVGCIPPACWLWEGGGSVQGEGGCCPWGMLSRACCLGEVEGGWCSSEQDKQHLITFTQYTMREIIRSIRNVVFIALIGCNNLVTICSGILSWQFVTFFVNYVW